MTLSIREIIDRKKRPEASVPIVLDGDLAAEYDRLATQLRDAGPPTSLADDTSAGAVAERMEVLRARMVDSRVFFRLRGLSEPDWAPVRDTLPKKRDGQDEDEAAEEYHRWLCAVVAVSCVEPAMTADEVHELYLVLSNGEWAALAGQALALQNSRQDVPFSAAASAISRHSAGKSRRPEQPAEPPAPSSLADSGEPSPATSTTTPPDA